MPPAPDGQARVMARGSGWVCSKCGNAVRRDAATCKHCGAVFIGPTGRPVKVRRTPDLKTIGLLFVGVSVVVCGVLATLGTPASAPLAPTVAPLAAAPAPTEAPAPTVAPTARPAATRRPAPTTAPGRDTLTATEVGDAWPLTVSGGTFRCDGMAVLFVAEGTTYALNGIARGRMGTEGWADIQAIWRDDPSGLKMNIAPVLDAGLRFCQG